MLSLDNDFYQTFILKNKFCKGICGKYLPLDNFYKTKNRYGNEFLETKCKGCRKSNITYELKLQEKIYKSRYNFICDDGIDNKTVVINHNNGKRYCFGELCGPKGLLKPLTEFYVHRKSNGRNQYYSICKKCHNYKRRSGSNTKLRCLNDARNSARRRNIKFNLTIEDIPDIPKYCPIFTWIKLNEMPNADEMGNSPSVDRIDNNKGYVKGNIQIISYRANRLKSDSSLKERKRLYEYFTE